MSKPIFSDQVSEYNKNKALSFKYNQRNRKYQHISAKWFMM